ncbi:MAG TPA: hypothetical protein DD979_10020 [Gammaproteobacteria bacterium]|nr:hypothetical protein [Gammaproteobacteria bacterium]
MRRERGYVLLSLMFILFLLASVSLLLNREGGMSVHLSGSGQSVAEAKALALAGINHAIWRANQQDCSGYTDVALTSFGPHQYQATVSPTSGSPVRVSAEALLSDGTRYVLSRDDQPIFQPDYPRHRQTTEADGARDAYVTTHAWFRSWKLGIWDYFSVSGDDNGVQRYGLLYFELTDIPSDAHILDARLRLHANSIDLNSNPGTVTAHRLLLDWSENQANYYNASDGVSWQWPDAFATDVESAVSVDSTASGEMAWDLTELVSAWHQGQWHNYGVALRADDAVEQIYYAASEDDTAALVPTLEVRYTCVCGASCGTIQLPPATAHWPFDETSGSIAAEIIGGHDGDGVDITWTAGQLQGAVAFDGNSASVRVPHATALSFSGALTLSAWAYLDVEPTGSYAAQTISTKGTDSHSEEHWFGVWEHELEFGFMEGGTFRSVATDALAVGAGAWYHFAVTFDSAADEVRFYRDGVQVDAIAFTHDLTPISEDILIGSSQYGEYWYGKLDDLRLFDSVLSLAEIQALTQAGGVTPAYTQNLLDRFNDRVFSGNHGSFAWTADWEEIGESDGADSGDVRVRSDSGREDVLMLKDNDNGGEGVQRRANLASCSTAELAFESRRDGLDNNDDAVIVSVSANGGADWVELGRIQGDATDADYQPQTYDITSHMASDTVIRLRTSPSMGNGDKVFIDNLEVRLTGCS